MKDEKNFQLRVKIVTKHVFLLIMSILLITFAMYQYPKLKNIVESLNSILAPIYYGIAIAYLLLIALTSAFTDARMISS